MIRDNGFDVYKVPFRVSALTILKDPGGRGLSATVIEDAGLIADALVVPSGGDSHWDDAAQNFKFAIWLGEQAGLPRKSILLKLLK